MRISYKNFEGYIRFVFMLLSVNTMDPDLLTIHAIDKYYLWYLTFQRFNNKTCTYLFLFNGNATSFLISYYLSLPVGDNDDPQITI